MAERNAAHPLEIRLFGHPDVRLHNEPLPPLRSRRGLWLLALLTLRAGREVERSWLAGTLWADSDEPQALASLRRTLTDLRQALGDQAATIQSPTPHTLRFVLGENWADVAAFDAALEQGDEEGLQQAIGLHCGILLEGCHEEWVLAEREPRGQALLDALETLAERALSRQEWGQAAQLFRRVIGQDALRESAQRGLMNALASDGSFAAATQCYRDFRILLRREMNADPDPETVALYRELREKARQAAEKPNGFASSSFASLAREVASDAVVSSLPTPLTNFVGRESAVRDIEASLSSSRLVSLCGTGGIGKTRLAIQVAHDIADDFPDGAWFADLSALTDPALVPQSVATLLQVREQADSSLMETLCAALRTKSLLLVLDNCEHLIAACRSLADSLLKTCPNLRILATTRQPLEVGGECVWRVPPLSLPDESAIQNTPPEEWLEQSEALRLFVERAKAVMPTFALTAHSAPATIQICRQLDGIALALELAAARVRILSVEQISLRLQDRFRLLTDGSKTAPARQQTLRGVIDWSYELLSEPERLLFARLAVFSGGWTLEAAESISGDDVLDTLANLADKSLIVVQGSEAGAARYGMMDSIRHYARERLQESGEEEHWRRRHGEYFVSLAEQAEHHLTDATQAEWFEILEREHDNIRTVLKGADEGETRCRISAAIWRFWVLRGYCREGLGWFKIALAESENADLELRVRVLGSAAVIACEQTDFALADRCFEECLAIRRQMGDPARIARVLNNWGLSLSYQGRYEETQALLEEALAVKRQLNDPRSTAQTVGNLGMVACRQGRYAEARKLHQECLELGRKAQDTWTIAWALGNTGNAALLQGDTETARACFRESLLGFAELHDKPNTTTLLRLFGMLFCRQSDWERGVRLLAASVAMVEQAGVNLSVEETTEQKDVFAAARKQMGEEAFERALQEGRVMTPASAAALAMEETANGPEIL